MISNGILLNSNSLRLVGYVQTQAVKNLNPKDLKKDDPGRSKSYIDEL